MSRSNYWQTLYTQSKETWGIQIFKNTNNFTQLQVVFLNYLNFFSSLYLDIATGEVDELVLKNDIYEDAYMYFRNKEYSKTDKTKIPDIKDKNRPIKDIKSTSKWIFRKSKK